VGNPVSRSAAASQFAERTKSGQRSGNPATERNRTRPTRSATNVSRFSARKSWIEAVTERLH
jgi:hypothetical protein